MRKAFRNGPFLVILVTLGLGVAAIAGTSKKTKPSAFLNIENKTCAYYLRYPRGSTLEHPSDCALKIILPTKDYPKWISEADFTLYTAPPGTDPIAETPDGESSPAGFIMAGGLKFTKTVFADAAMSHRYITVLYEAQGKSHRYRLQGFLTAVVPEVMDLHVKNWDPEKSAEKIFDGMALNFRPME
jgi:hypothetical protein